MLIPLNHPREHLHTSFHKALILPSAAFSAPGLLPCTISVVAQSARRDHVALQDAEQGCAQRENENDIHGIPAHVPVSHAIRTLPDRETGQDSDDREVVCTLSSHRGL